MTQNDPYSPLKLNDPLIKERAALKPLPPRFVKFFSKQKEHAKDLKNKVTPIVKDFSKLSPEQRKAVFFKIKHNQLRINLTGTGLRVFAEGDEITLAAAKGDSIEALLNKIDQFEHARPKAGHLAHEDLVFAMTDFAIGEPRDRLSEQLDANYLNLIDHESLIYEIELLANADGSRIQAQQLNEILTDLQAAISLDGVIYEHEVNGAFARAVVRTSGKKFQHLVESPEWQTRIIRFEQRPHFETFLTTLSSFNVSKIQIDPPKEDDPTVCIIDSGITPTNPLIEPVIRESECTSFVENNASIYDEYNHGSGVASLAAFQEINISAGAQNSAGSWIVSARVLDETNTIKTRLLSKVLTELVEHYVDRGIRIFNLSVCVDNKPWNERSRRAAKRSSWIARKIDQISKSKDIVFVVSAGNLTLAQVNQFITSDGATYPGYFQSDDCKILDPSQAALAITVGSIVPGTMVLTGRSTVIADKFQPSPFTRVGPGIIGEIKPELVDFGGNWVQTIGTNRVTTNPSTDVLMANNKQTPALMHAAGSSYAAPRVTHKLARILKELSDSTGLHISAPLLRAFLVNSATIRRSGFPGDEVEKFAENFSSVGSLARILGYGTPDASKAVYGDDYTVSCFYQGSLKADEVAFFRIPVPAELKKASGKKRMNVTVAFAPEVHQSGLKNYLGSRLQWRLFRGDATETEVIGLLSKEDLEQEEDDEESTDCQDVVDLLLEEAEGEAADNTKEVKRFRYGLRNRSKGTVQHDVFQWTHHKEEYSQNDYLLAVSLFKRWSAKAVPYAVVIRLEDSSFSVPIYTRVKTRLLQARVRART